MRDRADQCVCVFWAFAKEKRKAHNAKGRTVMTKITYPSRIPIARIPIPQGRSDARLLGTTLQLRVPF